MRDRTSPSCARRSSATCRSSSRSSGPCRCGRCRSSTTRWSASTSSARSAYALFGDGDPTAVHYRGEPYRVSREDGMYVLQVELPFTREGRAAAVASVGRARAAGRRLAADAAPAAGADRCADEGREDGPTERCGSSSRHRPRPATRRTTMTELDSTQPDPACCRRAVTRRYRRTNAWPSSSRAWLDWSGRRASAPGAER